ncbi:MAG: peptidoglycan bridge formation glycyltransferase FemA/FemB family protein, partial [Pygmaiobacter sp.]
MFEILKSEQYGEVEAFVSTHPAGSFMQSPNWAKVKPNWKHEIVAVRDGEGQLCGTMSILIMPMGPGALLYAPRGPVCDYTNAAVLGELLRGAHEIAKQYHAHILKMDPYILEGDTEQIAGFQALGCDFTENAGFKETIQPRYNYMLPYISGLSEDELLCKFVRETRYYVRYAQKQGVVCRYGADCLDDFYSVYSATGDRQGFSVRPKSYLAGFLAAFPDHARLYMCYSPEGTPICGGLSVNYAGRTAHVYGCSSDDHALRRLRATYLLQ